MFDRCRCSLATVSPHKYILQRRHNGSNGVSNDQPNDCLLSRLFGRRSKKTSKFRVTGLCAGNSPVIGEFPAQRASNAEMFPFDYVIMSAWFKWSSSFFYNIKIVCNGKINEWIFNTSHRWTKVISTGNSINSFQKTHRVPEHAEYKVTSKIRSLLCVAFMNGSY